MALNEKTGFKATGKSYTEHKLIDDNPVDSKCYYPLINTQATEAVASQITTTQNE
jgi:hypothetical protein